MTQTYTHLHMEAATCLWEAMLENREDTEGYPGLDEAFDFLGTVEMRHMAIALADDVLKVWDSMTEDEKEKCIPYDWEFVPEFLKHVEADACGVIRPTNHREMADLIISSLSKEERI